VTVEEAIRNTDGRFSGVRCRNGAGSYEIRSRYVVDASGQAGLLANVVGRREYDSFFKNMALFGYFAGGRRLPPPNEGNIVSAAFSKGWFWYIPLRPDLTSVGVVLPKENLPLLRTEDRRALYRSLISECPVIADLVGSTEMVKEGPYSELRVLRDFSFANRRYFADGAVLVGDAACFIDPVFSSGVHLATLAGLHAARAINSCIADGMTEELAFGEFERRYRREFGVFYQFLVAFYDVHQDEESYFWAARKIVDAANSDKDAFIRLVAGVSSEDERFSSVHRFVDSTIDESRILTHASKLDSNWAERDPELAARAVEHLAVLGRERGELFKHGEVSPIFAGGLVPSPSRLRWRVQDTA
jgi:halogenation protein CepH